MNKWAYLYAIHCDPWMYFGVLSDEFQSAEHDCLIFNLIYS